MVIATFTYTADRDTRIDFSRAYYKATGRFLVANSAPNNYLPTIGGKTVATTSGSIYDRWVKNCFKDTKLVVTDSFTNALLAFRDGRAEALMWDDTVLARHRGDRSQPEAHDRHVPRSCRTASG